MDAVIFWAMTGGVCALALIVWMAVIEQRDARRRREAAKRKARRALAAQVRG